MTEFFLRSRWSRVDMFTLGIVLTFLASSSVLPKIGKWEGDHWPVSGQSSAAQAVERQCEMQAQSKSERRPRHSESSVLSASR